MHTKLGSRDIAPARSTILIVDDNPDNLGFLFDYFVELGYKVLVALNGLEALDQLELIKPDVILLDVMMPKLDGFDTCIRLKGSPATRDIPVIFMTALSSPEDKVRGFEVGAVDYVTKPVYKEEVQARVRAHIAITSLQRELEGRNQELQAFSHMVAHDLREPLNTIVACTELILEEWTQCRYCSATSVVSDLELVRDAGQHMNETIDALLSFAGISQAVVVLQPVDMKQIIDEVVQDMQALIRERGGAISCPDTWPTALGHPAWLKQVWSNYISNGLKYGGAPPELELGADAEADVLRFWIRDNGVGVPEDDAFKLFEPLARMHANLARGHGLGLSIVQRIIQRLGGQVGAARRPAGGSEFYFTLPRA